MAGKNFDDCPMLGLVLLSLLEQLLEFVFGYCSPFFLQKDPERLRAEAIAPVQNKIGAFLADPVLNTILTKTKSSFRLREVMDKGKILLVNLAKGRLGEDSAALLGSL